MSKQIRPKFKQSGDHLAEDDLSSPPWLPEGDEGGREPEAVVVEADDEDDEEVWVDPTWISVLPGNFHVKVEWVIEGLAQVMPPIIFSQGDKLVEVVNDRGTKKVSAFRVENLRTVASRHIRFYKPGKKRENGTRPKLPADPPTALLASVLAAQTDWARLGVQEFVTVSPIPVLRKDGTFVTAPGFDLQSGIYYDPDLPALKVPEQVTDKQVRAAVKYLRHLFVDVQFADREADFANTLALMLGEVLKTMLPHDKMPAWVITGNQQGAGKGTLLEICQTVLFGRISNFMSYPSKEDEVGKKLVAELLRGGRMIVFDNVKRKVYNDEIAAYLTADHYSGRLLGGNETISPASKPIMTFTGNNFEADPDVAGRAVYVELLAPKARFFEHREVVEGLTWTNVLVEAAENREKYLRALYVIVRWWLQNGRPSGSVHTRFPEFSRAVSGVLELAGVVGFMGNAAKFREGPGSDDAQWGAWLAAWHVAFGEKALRGRAIGQAILEGLDERVDGPVAAFAEGLPEQMARLVAKDGVRDTWLGTEVCKLMRHQLNKPFYHDGAEYRIEKSEDKRNKTLVWKIVRVAASEA